MPVKSLKVSMSKSSNDLPSESALPSSVSISRGIVNAGYRVLGGLDIGTTDTQAPVLLVNESFMCASHTTWLTVLNRTKSALAKDASVEYSRFQLSEKVTYDAVAIGSSRCQLCNATDSARSSAKSTASTRWSSKTTVVTTGVAFRQPRRRE